MSARPLLKSIRAARCSSARTPAAASVALAALLGSAPTSAAEAPPAPPLTAYVIDAKRPDLARALRVCSTVAPVCVHASAEVSPAAFARARSLLERTYDALFTTLRIPAPLRDGARGGGPEIDAYLVGSGSSPTAGARSDGVDVHRDPLALLEDRDAASGFLSIDSGLAALDDARDCAAESAIAAAWVRLSAIGLDVAETPAIVAGLASYEAALVTGCNAPRADALSDFQRGRSRALADDPAAADLLAWFLDTHKGARTGAIVPALLSMSTQHRGIVDGGATRAGPSFSNDTSLLDVLRVTLSDQGTDLDALSLELANARATELEAPPRFDWQVAASSLPRRLMVREGVPVGGATFVRIDLDPLAGRDATRALSDGIELDLKWDQGARFRWNVLKLGLGGEVLGIVTVPELDTLRELTVEVRNLAATRALVLVGVNTGDREHPWSVDAPTGRLTAYEVSIFASK